MDIKIAMTRIGLDFDGMTIHEANEAIGFIKDEAFSRVKRNGTLLDIAWANYELNRK